MKLKNFAEKYLTLHEDNKPSSLWQKRGILYRAIVPVFGETEMNEITQLDVDEWIARLRDVQRLSNKTINNHTTVLRNLLKKAKRYPEVTGVFRLPEILRQRPAEYTAEFLSPTQASLLLSLLKDRPLWYALVLTGLNTGLRVGELRALTWRRVELGENARLTVTQAYCGYGNVLGTPKGHKSRVVPLNKRVVEVLQNLDRSTEFVFTQPRLYPGPRPALSYKACHFRMRWAGAKLRLPWLGCHSLRHTFASHLAMSGKVTILEIKELLGHVDISVTMKYAKLMPSTLIRAVSVLDET